MVIRELIKECVGKLKDSNIENAVFDANLIVRTYLGLKPIDIVLEGGRKVSDGDTEKIRSLCRRRCQREPLQYILGVWEFMGLELEVNKGVLVPRADTEVLAETVLSENKGMNVLDICSGSGCIALSIAHYNSSAFVTGIDISDSALELSRRNAEKTELSKRVRFEKCDILNEIPDGVYDVIVSNPPYIETAKIDKLQKEVSFYEPRIALDGGEDGLLFYRRICSVAPKLLQQHGKIYFEVGHSQADAVERLMADAGLKNIGRIKDLCEVERVLCAER